MIKIGITGGIGSGKSYVSHLLEEAGIPAVIFGKAIYEGRIRLKDLSRFFM